MIPNTSSIDTLWVQTFNSCLLASYAIAGNYFTGIHIPKFFEDYCQHFTANGGPGFEQAFDHHFNTNPGEWRRRGVSGLQIVCELHNLSNANSFTSCRSIFTASYYGNSHNKGELESRLKDKKAFLIVSYNVNGSGVHAVVVFHDSTGLKMRDPNFQILTPISDLRHYDSFGGTHDCIIVEEIV